jgi:hypothetical protein
MHNRKSDQNGHRGQTGDQIVGAEPVRQPGLQPKILDPGAVHRAAELRSRTGPS